jgi:transcriptional regulator
MSRTRRQLMVDQLLEYPCTVRDLAGSLNMRLRDVADDLAHVRRSVGKRLQVSPAVCERCGREVDRAARFTAPSRCPDCRSERLSEPELWIEPE